jgi:hypothetical protein
MATDAIEHGVVLTPNFEKDSVYCYESFKARTEPGQKIDREITNSVKNNTDYLIKVLQLTESLEENAKNRFPFVVEAKKEHILKNIVRVPIYPLLFASLVLNSHKKK